jgi:hypothetical protein
MILDPRSAAIFVFLAGLVLALTAIVANAQNAPTYTSRPVDWFDRDGNHVRYYRTRHRKHAYERRQEVRGWHSQARGYYPSHDHDEGQCKAFLARVGDQYASESGAQQEADKAWMQEARWAHGERYMSRENARNVTYECGRSSVGSVVGQVFYRCRLRARPCSPEATRGDR